MSLISELRRRNVIRMAVLYVVSTWLIMQVAEVIISLAQLPAWIGSTLLVALAIGFPIALVFSWFYEITPEGLALEKDVPPGDSITHVTGRRLDFIVIALLSAAVIIFAFDKWGGEGRPENSVAVLPFTDMSPAGDHKYFSDGLAEEILNLLTRVNGLSVTSRTSSFSFADASVDIPEIAAALNVAYILEGSVRRSGERLRITAQLIDADSDSHLWSQTYDREMKDIFDTQDEIAALVIESLKISIADKLPVSATTDPVAYSLFLQARHLWRQGSQVGIDKAYVMLNRALAIDPNYARAWLGLGTVYTYKVDLGQIAFEEGYRQAKEVTERALEIDPDNAEALSDLGWYAMTLDRDYSNAASFFHSAREISPNDSHVLGNSATYAAVIGRLDDAIELLNLAIEHDPIDSAKYTNLGAFYLAAKRLDEAESAFAKAMELSPSDLWTKQGIVLLRILQNRAPEALELSKTIDNESFQLAMRPLILHELGLTDDARIALGEARDSVGVSLSNYEIAEVYAHLMLWDEAFEALDRAIANSEDVSLIRASPFLANLSEDPRWTDILVQAGLADEQLSGIEL